MVKDVRVIICDDKGIVTGEYADREIAHEGSGKKHLAIAVLLYNKIGKVLLQKRKHKRFDNLWDLTGVTDLHRVNGKDESFEKSTKRCLKREYSIEGVDLKRIAGFNYFAASGDLCENEYCMLLVGEYEGEVKLNPEVGYGFTWMDQKVFFEDIQENFERYTPWAKESVKILQGIGFFK